MSSDYQFWLTANSDKQKIKLPVNPTKISVKRNEGSDSMDIAELGGITILKGRPPLEFSFSSIFPSKKFPGVKVDDITSPKTLIGRIGSWIENKRIIHFVVTACNINIYATIENFTYSESGGDVGTYEYSLTLKEYREIKTRQVKVDVSTKTATVGGGEARVDNSGTPKTYTVVYGDCLWNLAKKFYGSGSLYTKIYEANKSLIGPNPNILYVGWILTIPD